MSRITKHVVQTALAAGTLGVAAALAMGTANAAAADDQFLATLHQQGIGFGDPQSAIKVAHHACDALAQGIEPSDISGQLVSHNPGIDRQSALLIVVDAAQFYCPQFIHTTADGVTVVGPNR